MSLSVSVRDEVGDDAAAVREVVRHAFGRQDEADLVERLRADGNIVVALVAESGGKIVGHIVFSDLPIETSKETIRGAALAPLAVAPDRQGVGVGSLLVRHGLERCRTLGVTVVIVVGHADYYPRFGFSPDPARCLRAPFSGPSFMALELYEGALAIESGTPVYAPAFGLVPE